MKNTWGKTIYYSIIIILAAQLSMNLFIADFKISVAVICFSVFLFLTEDFPLIPVTLFSAAGVFASRVLFYWFRSGELSGACASYMPEMSFYICYGLLLYLYTKLYHTYRGHKNLLMLPLILIDYIANISELFLRLGTGAWEIKAQTGIFLVACLRTLIIWCVLTIFERYRLLLLKQEHEERYKRLLLLISKLNGEVVWMKKNAALIEDTMNTSYHLYEKLKKSETDSSLSASALTVAKDIHEIKKEYLLIMRGISEALEKELKSDGMYLEELFLLLKDSMLITAKEQKKELLFTFSCEDSLYTDQHYALMSVFRNLFMNALEAGKKDKVHLQVTEHKEAGDYIFTVTDDGPGIPPSSTEEIFQAGFSTKINYETGEINRGLGLNLVKDLIEAQFCGNISLTSVPGQTTFTIKIPTEKIEVHKK